MNAEGLLQRGYVTFHAGKQSVSPQVKTVSSENWKTLSSVRECVARSASGVVPRTNRTPVTSPWKHRRSSHTNHRFVH